ncbi:MAG: hypothetical protein IKE14_00885 [Loktanella sp.]|nr:hypothetical protein [Loktanella sp.]
MKYLSIWEELAEDVIAIAGDSFDVLFSARLKTRSTELRTAATPQELLADVCEDFVRGSFAKLVAFRTGKFGACYMNGNEVGAIAEALQPLCVRAFPTLNAMLGMNRDYLFPSYAYVEVMGTLYVEEAPSVTFVRFLNTMERLKASNSAAYTRNVLYVTEVHALNRAANVMPRVFHIGFSGRLKPDQTYDEMKEAEKQEWRDMTGIHRTEDLLAHAGLA